MTDDLYNTLRNQVPATNTADGKAIVTALMLIAEELRRWRLGIVTNEERAAQLGVGKWT